MIHVKKKIGKARLALILCAVFAVLLTVSIIAGVKLLGKTEEREPTTPPEILDDEALSYNMTVAYPVMNIDDLQTISVRGKDLSYDLLRSESEGCLVLRYTDENGEKKIYYPDIAFSGGFNYESLYAIEMNDGYGRVPKLYYLCLSLCTPYFEERIFFSEDEEEMKKELVEYGLDEEHVTRVTFYYKDKDGNEQKHELEIGEKNVNMNGYSFRVDGRAHAYTSQNNYYDYLLGGYENLLKATLVAQGLSDDRGQEPYLTTGFYEWKNTVHKDVGDVINGEGRLVLKGRTLVPLNGQQDTPSNSEGYIDSGISSMEIDLDEYVDEKGNIKPGYERLLAALNGKSIGVYDDPITFSLLARKNQIDLTGKESLHYTYVITGIESVLTENGEISDTGATVSGDDMIKVTYNVFVGGLPIPVGTGYHGVIDLSEDFVSSAARTALTSAKVGDDVSVAIDVEYSEENSIRLDIAYIITEIISIYDKNGRELSRVTDDAIVSYKYKYMTDGKLGDEVYTAVLDFSSSKEENASVLEVLKGKSVGKDLMLVADSYTAYCEYVYDFMTYEVSEIEYFITKRLISAFRFQNSSERDPYYGESIYENLMTDEHRLYGINSGSCQNVVKILGGISTGESNTADGFFGEEVLAVGLTPEVMRKYGLYAYTVYFELPRQIFVIDNENAMDEDALDDYGYYDTLGFHLYISEEQIDGTRYVASDMYDIVTVVPSTKFAFLKYEFVDFWARRDMFLMDIDHIEDVELSLTMEDVTGDYDIYLYPTKATVTSTGAQYDTITVTVVPVGDCPDNKLMQYIESKGYEFVSLTEFYNSIYGKDKNKETFPDSTGTSSFKDLMRMIYFIQYSDTLTKEEQQQILEDGNLLMKMSFKIKSSAHRYVFEYYRSDDRRVMVRIYQADQDGNISSTPVSDFYISTFAFKKIVRNVLKIFDGEIVDIYEGYED